MVLYYTLFFIFHWLFYDFCFVLFLKAAPEFPRAPQRISSASR